MNTKNESPEITHNSKKLCFESFEGISRAHLDYKWYKKDMAFMHTLVPVTMQGRGIATALAKAGLDYAMEHKLLILVFCPVVSKYIKKHPEYAKLINPDYYQI
ncbi:MAG: N-acetyltransferase [Bacteroidetes bacterium]|nr:MAG: N-acetyltransferase [Bacteroidota bacterium]